MFTDFGGDNLNTILSHYETILKNGVVDDIAAVFEWTALKNALYSR